MANSYFTPINGVPAKDDPYIYLYNNKSNGGKSLCINGKPLDPDRNVLSNCVGWACARFNQIYNLMTGYEGIRFPNFCCNAENFIEVAKKYGLTVSQEPQVGAIMVWQKGATLKSSDGAGHVCIVEDIYTPTYIATSNSGYNYKPYYPSTRTKGSGNWGASSAYTFRGFIYNPAVEEREKITITEPVDRNPSVDQIQIIVNKLRVRTTPSISGTVLGYAKPGYYNILDIQDADGYTWYKIAEDNYVAYSSSWITVLPKESNVFVIGDIVRMEKNAPIYGKKSRFAKWVYNSNLYVRAINGNKITISIYKSGAITGSVDKKYLTKI